MQPLPSELALRARALGHDVIAAHPPGAWLWSWRTAILLHGLVTLGAATGDAELLSAVHTFFENPRHARVGIRRSDAAACALPALVLYESTGERVGLPFVDRALQYLVAAPSSDTGAVYHLGSELWARPLPDSVWADSLMMVGVLLARASVTRNDPQLRALALTQMRAFITHLQDPGVGLFRHADIPVVNVSFPTQRAFWLRGNGWMLAAAAEMCGVLGLTREEHAELADAFEPAAFALLGSARNDGSWPNLLRARPCAAPDVTNGRLAIARDEHEKIESSGTALVGAGMLGLARLGMVTPYERYRDAGLAATAAAVSCITRNARGRLVLRNTKGPTNAGPSFTYALVPETVNADYGVGSVLLAAAAAVTSSAPEQPALQARRSSSAA
jgi:rhamnogalacturonyl hydrolase YesR